MLRRFIRLTSEIEVPLRDVPARVGGGKALNPEMKFRRSEVAETSGREVAVSPRLPEEFVRETLIPHMDRLITRYIVSHTPPMLTSLLRTYAQYTHMRESGQNTGPIVERLMDTIKYRMAGYQADDIVASLHAAYLLAPDDDELFTMFLDRIKKVENDMSVPGWLAAVRTYSRLPERVHDLHDYLIPKAHELVKQLGDRELVDLVLVCGVSGDTGLAADVNAFRVMLPELERRVSELPVPVAIDVFWALAKNAVFFEAAFTRLVADLGKDDVVSDLPGKYLVRSLWAFAKVGKSEHAVVKEHLVPAVVAMKNHLSFGDVARLSQTDIVFPQGFLEETSSRLRSEWLLKSNDSAEFKESLFFLLTALTRTSTLNGEVWKRILADVFPVMDHGEIRRLMAILLSAGNPKYGQLLDDLPEEWSMVRQAVVQQLRMFSPSEPSSANLSA